MDKDLLFIKTLEDIEKKMKSQDGYEIFMISSLLRKLLIDGYPLMDKVNQSRKVKVTFRINDRKLPLGDPTLTFYSMEDGFDPDTSVPHLRHPIEVDRGKLLKAEIMVIKGEVITIEDLIKFLCHVEGSVHAGTPKNTKEQALKEIQKHLGVGALPPGIRTMLSISRVVLKGLKPLRTMVDK